MKGTAVFGGSQMFTMLANIVKGKFTAIFLGTGGMGVSSLLNSALAPMQQLFTFSLPTAGVRDIANEEDAEQKAHKVLAFRRVLFVLAVLGMITMAVGAPLLSISTFGSSEHTLWFVALSVALLFLILTTGENAVLQGYRKLKTLATCNVVSALCGVLVGVPLYYFYGIEGIVPSIIIMSVVSFLYTRYFTRTLHIIPVQQSWGDTWKWGRVMLLFGGTMMIAGVIGSLSTYLLNTFIRSYGDISDVGLFQAANTITLQCTSLVFTAMATDYYPHLSSVADSQDRMTALVRQQGEIVVLIIAPVASLLVLFSPLAVRVLLTSEFDSLVPLLRLIAVSFMGRAFCFPLDYVCLAKGDKSFFFWVDGIWTNVKTFLFCVAGYYFFGLIGLGYAMVANAVIDIFVSALLCRYRYGVVYDKEQLRLFLPFVSLLSLQLLVSYISDILPSLALMMVIAAVICIFAYRQLDQRINFRGLLKR
mgnify:CR=1 FL=1